MRDRQQCAILWYKVHSGPREAFQAMYTKLRTNQARKVCHKYGCTHTILTIYAEVVYHHEGAPARQPE